MKKQWISLDTSVFGGLYDEEFKGFHRTYVQAHKNSEFEIIYSDIAEQELENAPERIRATTKLLPEKSTKFVKSDIETVNLAKRCIEEGAVGATSYVDCLHNYTMNFLFTDQIGSRKLYNIILLLTLILHWKL